jgi:hypothetical protein
MDSEKDEQKNIEETKKAATEELNALTNPKAGDQAVNPLSFSSDSIGFKKMQGEKQENAERPIIRTYKTDTEEAIQAGHLSSISIAVSENKRMMNNMQKKEEVVEVKKKRISKGVLIISFILILCGVLAVAVPYLLVQKENETPINIQPISSSNIMTTDLEDKVSINNLSKTNPAGDFSMKIESSATSLGQVKDFLLTKGSGVDEKAVTSAEFLDLIRAHAPPDITRTLRPEFMLGLHNFSGNQKFLILKVGAYDATFSGMLAWENYLWQDLKILFNLSEALPVQEVSSSTASTTGTDVRTSSISSIEIKKFQDAEFSNKDTRVVEDHTGKIIFLYSIIDENTVVIATNVNTLKEIMTRMSKARVITQ